MSKFLTFKPIVSLSVCVSLTFFSLPPVYGMEEIEVSLESYYSYGESTCSEEAYISEDELSEEFEADDEERGHRIPPLGSERSLPLIDRLSQRQLNLEQLKRTLEEQNKILEIEEEELCSRKKEHEKFVKEEGPFLGKSLFLSNPDKWKFIKSEEENLRHRKKLFGDSGSFALKEQLKNDEKRIKYLKELGLIDSDEKGLNYRKKILAQLELSSDRELYLLRTYLEGRTLKELPSNPSTQLTYGQKFVSDSMQFLEEVQLLVEETGNINQYFKKLSSGEFSSNTSYLIPSCNWPWGQVVSPSLLFSTSNQYRKQQRELFTKLISQNESLFHQYKTDWAQVYTDTTPLLLRSYRSSYEDILQNRLTDVLNQWNRLKIQELEKIIRLLDPLVREKIDLNKVVKVYQNHINLFVYSCQQIFEILGKSHQIHIYKRPLHQNSLDLPTLFKKDLERWVEDLASVIESAAQQLKELEEIIEREGVEAVLPVLFLRLEDLEKDNLCLQEENESLGLYLQQQEQAIKELMVTKSRLVAKVKLPNSSEEEETVKNFSEDLRSLRSSLRSWGPESKKYQAESGTYIQNLREAYKEYDDLIQEIEEETAKEGYIRFINGTQERSLLEKYKQVFQKNKRSIQKLESEIESYNIEEKEEKGRKRMEEAHSYWKNMKETIFNESWKAFHISSGAWMLPILLVKLPLRVTFSLAMRLPRTKSQEEIAKLISQHMEEYKKGSLMGLSLEHYNSPTIPKEVGEYKEIIKELCEIAQCKQEYPKKKKKLESLKQETRNAAPTKLLSKFSLKSGFSPSQELKIKSLNFLQAEANQLVNWTSSLRRIHQVRMEREWTIFNLLEQNANLDLLTEIILRQADFSVSWGLFFERPSLMESSMEEHPLTSVSSLLKRIPQLLGARSTLVSQIQEQLTKTRDKKINLRFDRLDKAVEEGLDTILKVISANSSLLEETLRGVKAYQDQFMELKLDAMRRKKKRDEEELAAAEAYKNMYWYQKIYAGLPTIKDTTNIVCRGVLEGGANALGGAVVSGGIGAAGCALNWGLKQAGGSFLGTSVGAGGSSSASSAFGGSSTLLSSPHSSRGSMDFSHSQNQSDSSYFIEKALKYCVPSGEDMKKASAFLMKETAKGAANRVGGRMVDTLADHLIIPLSYQVEDLFTWENAGENP